MRRGLLVGALVLVALAACGPAHVLPAQTTPSPVVHLPAHAGPTPGDAPVRIGVILMENEEYGDIIGSSDTPYINRLAHRYALALQMYGISHPSLPNYLALTGGSTFGISSDCTDCSVSATNLIDQLARAGISWRAYMEGLPRPCYSGAGSGSYAKKHDPFMYYDDIASHPARCAEVAPLTRLYMDERAGKLPRFTWITPDLCHDMHDCSTATGDRFLAGLVPGLLRALGPRGLLFITWDEGSSDDGCCRLAGGGHVATIVAGPEARPGARLRVAVDHYSVLQTIEDVFGLRRLRWAACVCTPSLAGLLRTG
jgi:phosphatidylinositol-3-phosphatase